MKKNKQNKESDVTDMFSPLYRDGEPTFTWDWTIAIIMLGFSLFFAGLIMHII